MEKMKDFNEGNAYIKNVYFGFQNILPTKAKNQEKEVINTKPKKVKNNKKKKSRSKSKSNEKTKSKKNIKENDKIILKPIKPIIIKNEGEEEKIKENKKSKKNSKQKKKKGKKEIKIEKILNYEELDLDDENKEIQNKSKSKKKKKKKSKTKSKEKKQKKKSKSKNKQVQTQEKLTIKKNINNDILDDIEMDYPQYNEIKDDAMNVIDKHIQDLSLTFMRPFIPQKENNLTITKLKIKKESKRKSDIQNKNTINKNMDMNPLLMENETINKRPYTAHGYKVKSKSKIKKFPKMTKTKQEEEKIMAFKEKVYVHDKILSLFNNFNLIENANEKAKLSKTEKPKRINSVFTKNAFHHYMMPKRKDILKQQKIKKKEVEYYSDKYEEDSEEIKKEEKEENIIKNKNDKAIYLIKSSHKIYGKSQQSVNDIKNILNKDNIDTFMNNFLIKHNFTTKKEESKLNNNYYNIPDIKYYHGGKKIYKPKKKYITDSKLNNSDRYKNSKRYKLFNPKEIISNPNNKFNFFNQTFTKEPIYGKYFESPEIEKSINNNINPIPFNKWNPEYKIKKFIKEEKENPNDVYNYDFKYDDLNSDSDNELPNTDFKAKNMPKFKKIKFDYRNYKTGKLIKEKNDDDKITNNGDNFKDKNISHPFLIDDDYVNI